MAEYNEPKHKITEPYGVRPSNAPRIRDMKVGQIAQIVEPVMTANYASRETMEERRNTIRGAYIMRTEDGVVFLSLPRRGWGKSNLPNVEHAIRILPVGATLEITVGT